MANVDPTAFTALSLIQGALRKTGQYAQGEPIGAADISDALDCLNGLFDALSNESKIIFNRTETVFNFTPGQSVYTIGNEYAGVFSGTVTSGSPTITSVTQPQIGTNGSATSTLSVGATITGAGIPTGTKVIANGGTSVTMSANAAGTFVSQQIAFTSPAQIVAQRPVRLVSAYSRFNTSSSSVDFGCDIKSLEDYAVIGLKSQPGPWPKILFYNPTFPNAQMYFWPVPQQGVEFHLWAEAILQSVQANTVLNLPQGYYLWLQLRLVELLNIEYGAPTSDDVKRLIRQFESKIKSNNAYIDRRIAVDGAISSKNSNDAGFILTGGF